ncbi:MAG: hypothetical protein K6C98_10975 [Treponema sp.]|nr:hypothetical protein [Treponema sp.]
MKRLLVTFIGALLCLTNIFAQKIPAGRDILPLVLDFAYDKEYWVDSEIQVADIANNEYLISGYHVNKSGVGYTRQDYTVSISRAETTLIVSVSDLTTIGCNKEGVPLETATMSANTAKSTEKLAIALNKDLSKRINSWGDKEYKKKLDIALTSPVIMTTLARQSALVFKKFIGDNKIIGKPTEFEVKVLKIEASDFEGYTNCVNGQTFCGYKTGSGGIPKPEYVPVKVYTNNKPQGTYVVKGTIKDVKRADVGGLSVIEIKE